MLMYMCYAWLSHAFGVQKRRKILKDRGRAEDLVAHEVCAKFPDHAHFTSNLAHI